MWEKHKGEKMFPISGFNKNEKENSNCETNEARGKGENHFFLRAEENPKISSDDQNRNMTLPSLVGVQENVKVPRYDYQNREVLSYVQKLNENDLLRELSKRGIDTKGLFTGEIQSLLFRTLVSEKEKQYYSCVSRSRKKKRKISACWSENNTQDEKTNPLFKESAHVSEKFPKDIVNDYSNTKTDNTPLLVESHRPPSNNNILPPSFTPFFSSPFLVNNNSNEQPHFYPSPPPPSQPPQFLFYPQQQLQQIIRKSNGYYNDLLNNRLDDDEEEEEGERENEERMKRRRKVKLKRRGRRSVPSFSIRRKEVFKPGPILGSNMMCMELINGILTLSEDNRYIGGKGNNKTPLPRHTIELHPEHEDIKEIDPSELVIICYLLSHKGRSDQFLNYICTLDHSKFTRTKKGQYLCHFDNLVIRYSSHSKGPWFRLRFSLFLEEEEEEEEEYEEEQKLMHQYNNNDCIFSVDSQSFKTITVKGIRKRRKKLLEKTKNN